MLKFTRTTYPNLYSLMKMGNTFYPSWDYPTNMCQLIQRIAMGCVNVLAIITLGVMFSVLILEFPISVLIQLTSLPFLEINLEFSFLSNKVLHDMSTGLWVITGASIIVGIITCVIVLVYRKCNISLFSPNTNKPPSFIKIWYTGFVNKYCTMIDIEKP